MRSASAALAAAAIVMAAMASTRIASAHDAQRVKFVASVRIAAPAARVWAVIGNFQDLSWDTVVAATHGSGGNAPDRATRTIILARGGTLPDEQLVRYQAADYTYATFLPHVDVHVLPVTNYAAVLVVRPEADNSSTVEWRCAFYRGYPNFGPPPGLDEAAAIAAVRALTQPALDALKRRLEAGPAAARS